MRIIYLFNPDTDYALAHNRGQYTPPKKIVELRGKLALIPAIWAAPGEAVLTFDNSEESLYYPLAIHRGIKIVSLSELTSDDTVIPWGWNKALANTLIKSGVRNVPDITALDNIRELAHRRNSIRLHQNPDFAPREIESPVELERYLISHPDCYLKAPWSSSGRGVIRTTGMRKEKVLQWGEGIINQQGSLMAERAWDRVFDFATEWYCQNGEVSFQSFSIFHTSPEGRYLGNVVADIDTLRAEIKQNSRFDDHILTLQHDYLSSQIAGRYSGPIGIDMLADREGRVNPCVEINLRHTMGMVAAKLYALTRERMLWRPLLPSPEIVGSNSVEQSLIDPG